MASKHQQQPESVGESRRRFLRRVWTAAALASAGVAGGAAWLLARGGLSRRVADSMRDAEYTCQVVRSYPHDPTAFTQGLAFADGFLYEGTGLEGKSSLRKVELATGQVLRRHDLAADLFGEGIALVGDRIIQLTWKAGLAFVYDRDTFAERERFHYGGEGWGITFDGTHLITSDGSDTLRFRDPETFAEVRAVKVSRHGSPLERLNELEYVEGEVYANVWQYDFIARIDPRTGKVVGSIDVAGLYPPEQRHDPAAEVPNGIAYDARGKRLFLTGKNWPRLFEVRVVPAR